MIPLVRTKLLNCDVRHVDGRYIDSIDHISSGRATGYTGGAEHIIVHPEIPLLDLSLGLVHAASCRSAWNDLAHASVSTVVFSKSRSPGCALAKRIEDQVNNIEAREEALLGSEVCKVHVVGIAKIFVERVRKQEVNTSRT
jgi:metal-sulfur cluster biosynthetic enzyme